VHSVRLECSGRGLATCSGEVFAIHWVEVLVAKATSGSSGATPGNSITTSRMEDTDPASMGEPCSGF
jgi:hypothetical protein